MYKLTPNKAVNYILHALEFHSINYIVKLFIYFVPVALPPSPHLWHPSLALHFLAIPLAHSVGHHTNGNISHPHPDRICNGMWSNADMQLAFFFSLREGNSQRNHTTRLLRRFVLFCRHYISKHSHTHTHAYACKCINWRTHTFEHNHSNMQIA